MRRARRGARQGCRAPGPEAGQRDDRRSRPGADHGLRPGRRGAGGAAGGVRRNPGLHVPRAARGRRGHGSQRHLRPRPRAVRDVHGQALLRGQEPRRAALAAPRAEGREAHEQPAARADGRARGAAVPGGGCGGAAGLGPCPGGVAARGRPPRRGAAGGRNALARDGGGRRTRRRSFRGLGVGVPAGGGRGTRGLRLPREPHLAARPGAAAQAPRSAGGALEADPGGSRIHERAGRHGLLLRLGPAAPGGSPPSRACRRAVAGAGDGAARAVALLLPHEPAQAGRGEPRRGRADGRPAARRVGHGPARPGRGRTPAGLRGGPAAVRRLGGPVARAGLAAAPAGGGARPGRAHRDAPALGGPGRHGPQGGVASHPARRGRAAPDRGRRLSGPPRVVRGPAAVGEARARGTPGRRTAARPRERCEPRLLRDRDAARRPVARPPEHPARPGRPRRSLPRGARRVRGVQPGAAAPGGPRDELRPGAVGAGPGLRLSLVLGAAGLAAVHGARALRTPPLAARADRVAAAVGGERARPARRARRARRLRHRRGAVRPLPSAAPGARLARHGAVDAGHQPQRRHAHRAATRGLPPARERVRRRALRARVPLHPGAVAHAAAQRPAGRARLVPGDRGSDARRQHRAGIGIGRPARVRAARDAQARGAAARWW